MNNKEENKNKIDEAKKKGTNRVMLALLVFIVLVIIIVLFVYGGYEIIKNLFEKGFRGGI